jgi:hypothetical protein
MPVLKNWMSVRKRGHSVGYLGAVTCNAREHDDDAEGPGVGFSFRVR